ncbi:MAG: hypothetical protein ABJB12_23135 [Pseudomonadota bacterium]
MSPIGTTAAKPLQVFLDCSENDIGATAAESAQHNWVMANQRPAAALKAKGYHYRFTYAQALGHCDQRVFDLTLRKRCPGPRAAIRPLSELAR